MFVDHSRMQFFATEIRVFFLHSNPLLKIENSTKILKNNIKK